MTLFLVIFHRLAEMFTTSTGAHGRSCVASRDISKHERVHMEHPTCAVSEQAKAQVR